MHNLNNGCIFAVVERTTNFKILIMHAETNLEKYKGNYKVIEILGSIIVLNVDGKTTDFNIKEIKRFTTFDKKNYIKRK